MRTFYMWNKLASLKEIILALRGFNTADIKAQIL